MRLTLVATGIVLLAWIYPGLVVADVTFQTGDQAYVVEPTSVVDREGNTLGELSFGSSVEIELRQDDRVFVLSPKKGWLATAGLIPSGQDGLDALAKRIEQSPNDPALYLLRAKIALFPNGPYDTSDRNIPPALLQQAAGDIQRAQDLKAEVAATSLLKGCLHLAEDKPKLAVENLTTCLDTPSMREQLSQEELVTAHLQRADAWLKSGQPANARKDLVAATRAQPLNFAAQHALGQFALSAADTETIYATGNAMVVIRPVSDIGYRLQAIALMTARKPAEAIDALNRAIALPPEQAAEYALRARALFGLNQSEAALPDAMKAVAMSPDAIGHLHLLGQIQGNLGRHEEAIETLTKLIALDPGQPNYHLERAQGLMGMKRYREAIADWNLVRRSNPNDVYVLERLSTCYAWLGDFDKSIEFLDEAVKQNPDNSHAWHMRGERHLLVGHLPEAKHDLAIAIVKDRSNFSALVGLAQVYLALGEVGQAELCLEQTIPQLPDEARGYFLRGQVHYYNDKYVESLQDFDRCLALEPEHSLAHANRAYTLRSLGRLDEAVAAFDRSLELNPRRHQVYQGRGAVKVQQGKLREAIIDFTRAVELDPFDADSLLLRTHMYLALGHLDVAKQDLKAALEIRPNDSTALTLTAITLLRERDMSALKPLGAALAEVEQCDDTMSWGVVVAGFHGKLLHQEEATRPILEATAKRTNNPMYVPYLDYLRGKITREELEQSPIFYDQDYLAPTCIRGFLALIDERPETARQHFQWVIDNGIPNSMEVGVAKSELERLEAGE